MLLGQRQSQTGPVSCILGPGYQNLPEYLTKHHAPAHNKRICEIYIHASKRPMNRAGIRDSALRGCVNT
jgi:hypothetical protein